MSFKESLKKHDKKIIALFAALLLWYYVDSISLVEKEMIASIKYSHMPKNLIAIQLPKSIKYYIKTDKYYKESFNASDIYFEASLKKAQVGSNMIPLELKTPSSLPGYVKIEMPQNTIKVFFDAKIQKKLGVKLQVNNKLNPHFRIDSSTINPIEVTVEGGESYLNSLKEIETEEVELKKPGIQNLVLNLKPIKGVIKVYPPQVRARFSVVPNLVSQQVFIPVQLKGLNPLLKVKKITPHKIATKLSGVYEQSKKLDFKELFYYIDLEKYTQPGDYKIEIKASIPEDIEWETEVKQVDVQLVLKGDKE